MKTLALAAVLLAGFSAHAIAADLPSPPAAPATNVPSAIDWTGFYVGVEGGAGLASTSLNALLTPTIAVGSPRATQGILGAYAGYNFATGSDLVLGLEGDINA